MNMINKGIPYFPTPANFFDEEVMELLEAKFGVLASYMVMRLLCKIYKEGYYISWERTKSNFRPQSRWRDQRGYDGKDCRPVIGKRFFP